MSAWINQIFEAVQVKKRGIVRRSKADVDKLGGGVGNLKEAVRNRKFQLLESENEYVIICDDKPLTVVQL